MSLTRSVGKVLSFRWLRSRTSLSLAWERRFRAGEAAFAEGRIPEAEQLLRRALRQADTFDERDPRLAATLDALSRIVLIQGRPDQAIAYLRRTIALKEDAWGAKSPRLASSLADLARAYREAGRTGEAGRAHARALELLALEIGPDLPELERNLDLPGLPIPDRDPGCNRDETE